MSPEQFTARAKAEQEKWINPVGRLILSAASIERSLNEILEVLAPEAKEAWKKEGFFERANRVSDIANKELSDTLVKALKEQKRKYWPVMENRNAVAHNPLYIEAFGLDDELDFRAAIRHQQKDRNFELPDVQRFADEADSVAADFMEFAMHFDRTLQDEIELARTLLTAMHLRPPE